MWCELCVANCNEVSSANQRTRQGEHNVMMNGKVMKKSTMKNVHLAVTRQSNTCFFFIFLPLSSLALQKHQHFFSRSIFNCCFITRNLLTLNICSSFFFSYQHMITFFRRFLSFFSFSWFRHRFTKFISYLETRKLTKIRLCMRAGERRDRMYLLMFMT